MEAYLMSEGLTPASANAFGPLDAAADTVRSSLPPPQGPFMASAAPNTLTLARFSCPATSLFVTINAPPPSVITQQSRRCKGVAMIGEWTTSSTVTTDLNIAFGLYCA